MIVLPIEKDDRDRRRIRRQSAARAKWMNAARTGDEEAIEHLTTEDMDTYTALSNMIQNEKTDILSLVDTYFMPYGVECDHYSIMGEIQKSLEGKNINGLGTIRGSGFSVNFFTEEMSAFIMNYRITQYN